jgi:hypothetical protein
VWIEGSIRLAIGIEVFPLPRNVLSNNTLAMEALNSRKLVGALGSRAESLPGFLTINIK